MKYLGIDWGEKRIGLAVGDDETNIASPLAVVENVTDIDKHIRNEEIEIIVIGAPKTMAGDHGSNSEKVDIFKTQLEKFGLPIILVDERLSSLAGDALVGDKKTKASRDSIAAMLILQGYLDSTL